MGRERFGEGAGAGKSREGGCQQYILDCRGLPDITKGASTLEPPTPQCRSIRPPGYGEPREPGHAADGHCGNRQRRPPGRASSQGWALALATSVCGLLHGAHDCPLSPASVRITYGRRQPLCAEQGWVCQPQTLPALGARAGALVVVDE